MKAYMLPFVSPDAPFGDPVGDCLIGNKTLASWQAEILNHLGMEVGRVDSAREIRDVGEYIAFSEGLYFTMELMHEFITRSREARRPTKCALKSGLVTKITAVNVQSVQQYPERVDYQLEYQPAEFFRAVPMEPVVINADEFSATIMLPQHICGSKGYAVPLTEKLMVSVDHWVNLWIANILTVLSLGAKLKKMSKIRLLAKAARARSLNQWKVLRQFNQIGSNCDIHPTAYIEGSVLGDHVTVGAGTIIRNSIIGSEVNFGNGVVVEESVVGDLCAVLHGHIIYSVIYPSTFSVSNFITASMTGRDTFVGGNSSMTDLRFDDKNVVILRDGAGVDSGNRFLGSCLGHRSYFGAGVAIAPGRFIPCDMKIALDGDRIISTFRNNSDPPRGFRLL